MAPSLLACFDWRTTYVDKHDAITTLEGITAVSLMTRPRGKSTSPRGARAATSPATSRCGIPRQHH